MLQNKIFEKLLFTPDECDKIISLQKVNFQTWKNVDRDYESSSIFFNEDTKWIFEKLKKFFEDETGYTMLKLKEEIHFHTFTKEDWFGVHDDARDSRLFSVGVLLNDDFEGGDFKLYNPHEILVKKIKGNSYIFNVDISHEVTPIELGTR